MIAPIQVARRTPRRPPRSLGLSFPNPIAWMNQKIIEWMNIPKRLGDAFNKAAWANRSTADPRIQAAAMDAIRQVGDLAQQYDATTKKLVFKDDNLGILPVVIAVVAGVSIVSVAWAMVSIFRRTTAAEAAAAAAADLAQACMEGRIDCAQVPDILDGLNKSIEATPEEQGPISEMLSAGTDLVKLATVATVGALAWQFLGPMLQKRRR